MKTLEILDKYRKILAGILSCDINDITFYKDKNLIGELKYSKSEEEAREDAKDRGVPFNMDDYVFVATNLGLGDYVVKYEEEVISTWKLYQMPHCCAFMVSCNVNVTEKYRGMRIGTILNQFRQDIGRVLNYSSILCTDIEQNTHQRKLLKTNGWKDIHDVVNKRTKNRVYISVINI